MAAACLAVTAAAARAQEPAAGVPVHELSSDGFVRQWLLLGPLPNEELEAPINGRTRRAHDTDFLADLGGEAAAEISAGMTLRTTGAAGEALTAGTHLAVAGERGVVDFEQTFGKVDLQAVYATCQIRSDREQRVYFHTGSDDSIKVWVNGEPVCSVWVPARGCQPWSDHFSAVLRPGLNRVLVKVEDRGGEWKLVMEVYDEAQDRARQADQLLLHSSDWEIATGGRWDYMFTPGDFPRLRWRDEQLIQLLLGEVPLNVRWFDAELNEVPRAEKPGRYLAYIESVSPQGVQIRRSLTFYCRPPAWEPWTDGLRAYMDCPPGGPIDADAWNQRSDAIAEGIAGSFIEFLESRPQGGAYMAGLAEMRSKDGPIGQLDLPEAVDIDFHVALRARILGLDTHPLQPPQLRQGEPATALSHGSTEQADVAADLPEKLREVCTRWNQEGGAPFVALVARHGVIFFHEPFGEIHGRPVELDQRFPMASITKSLTGTLFAMFLDQGLCDTFDPVGKYLHGFPITGPKTITLHHCFTHTTGLEGHGEWGGLSNAWLDDAILAQLPRLDPGQVSIYNGMGFDLVGVVMQTITGKPYVRLMHENVFAPLGIEDVRIVDCAFGTDISAENLARIGQMMLNRGSYGELAFFRPETFERLLPQPIKPLYPQFDDDRGLGLVWCGNVGSDQVLGRRTIGHGAASSSVYRIDLDNDLVIVVARPFPGKDCDAHAGEFLRTIAAGLNNPAATDDAQEAGGQ